MKKKYKIGLACLVLVFIGITVPGCDDSKSTTELTQTRYEGKGSEGHWQEILAQAQKALELRNEAIGSQSRNNTLLLDGSNKPLNEVGCAFYSYIHYKILLWLQEGKDEGEIIALIEQEAPQWKTELAATVVIGAAPERMEKILKEIDPRNTWLNTSPTELHPGIFIAFGFPQPGQILWHWKVIIKTPEGEFFEIDSSASQLSKMPLEKVDLFTDREKYAKSLGMLKKVSLLGAKGEIKSYNFIQVHM